ncbi:hypothetical protein [Rhizobium leguminosarum]|uniref:hypothetical protein n=1 Tax=Rhizobium leguminosarum TaxID=384 RepID=UPI00027D8D76|nr:hypothetical protein [Rhizobium leguminosarum]
MDKTPKTAIRGMMLYVLALLVLGVVAGAATQSMAIPPIRPSDQRPRRFRKKLQLRSEIRLSEELIDPFERNNPGRRLPYPAPTRSGRIEKLGLHSKRPASGSE